MSEKHINNKYHEHDKSSHENHHTDIDDIKPLNLLITIILNFVITIAELIGGLLANSLALISDALHNFSDGVSVIITYVTHKISKRTGNPQRTFGYKRIEILAALFNAVVLIVISIYLFIEAYERFLHPEEIKGPLMFIVATIGLIANIAGVLLLKKGSEHNINVRASYLHLLTDVLSSVGVIIGGVLIFFYKLYWIDPLLTVLIGAYIIKETYHIVRQTVDILMQATPQGLDLDRLKSLVENLPEVRNIHHVHVWNLNDREVFFESHVDLSKDYKIGETEKIKETIHNLIHDKFGVTHSTIQFEYDSCDSKDMIITDEDNC